MEGSFMTMKADEIVQVLLRWRLRVSGVAAAIARDVHAADDIFQQVVLAALEDKGQFRDSEHLLAWAIRASRHRAIDLCRRRKMISLPDEVLDLIEAQWTNPTPASWSDRIEALNHCLALIGERSRELLQKKYTEGLTVAAIAAQVRRTPDAVYQMLSRVHRSLRECVAHELSVFESPTGKAVL
jgi:RNA polymerase sigma-70 factor (ECF subfamily)